MRLLTAAAPRPRRAGPAALLACAARRGLANKVFDSAAAAVKDIKDGAKLCVVVCCSV